MKYRYKFVLLIMIFSIGISADQKENSYKTSLKKWNDAAINEYFIKVSFSAFSPLAGVWELNVKGGKVYTCIFNGKANDKYNKAAEKFTMESLYKTAGDSIGQTKNGPFILEAAYGKNGFISSLAKIRNPEYKNRVKTDTTFSIEVLDFIPGGR